MFSNLTKPVIIISYLLGLTSANAFTLVQFKMRVPRGSVVKCLTRNPGVLGSSRTGSSGFFRGNVLGQDTSEPQPSTGETQERHE